MLRVGKAGQSGVATVEFHIVALFALLPLCLGTLQLALLLGENHHVDHAAFEAARAAAMANGDLDAARRGFARAASVLFVGSQEEGDGVTAGRVAGAYAAALADQALFGRFRIVRPDADVSEDFAIWRENLRVIPNDNLEYRSNRPGARSGLSIQQANVLRLEVTWCRPLIVPFARELLLGVLSRVDRDPWHRFCYARQRVPIRSFATAPMQSDFRVSS